MPGGSWRGWAKHGTAGAHEVTSGRLDLSARPRSRLFPKTRSWFALDSPLELLSPLSVLRALYGIAGLSWLLIGLLWVGDRSVPVNTAGILSVGALTAAIWVLLVRVHLVRAVGSRALVVYWTTAVALLVWFSRGSAQEVIFALFIVPIVIFAALFMEAGFVVLQLSAVALLLGIDLATGGAGYRALALAVLGCIVVSSVSLAVMMLTRSARRHDVVDPDTGVPNGFGLAQHAAGLDRPTFLVATVILSGIGEAREALGYQVGTELVRRAVEDLGQVVPRDAVIGRVDGDELVALLPFGAELVDALAAGGPSGMAGSPEDLPTPVADAGAELAGTLVHAIGAGRYLVGEIEVSLRAHVGLSAAPWDGSEVAELVRRASLSARRAARHGLSHQWWTGDGGEMTATDLALLGNLRLASERGELSLAYQPQIASATGLPHSVEALLRWTGPGTGPVSPGQFIPLAERTGLIDRLTEWVIVEALDAQVRWRTSGIDLPVSVNVSAKNLSDPQLSGWILARLHDRQLPASCLTVEVTETAVAEAAQAEQVLRPLQRNGVRISIDDFGTGFTSLAALPSLPLDELKVDQCFVSRSMESPADAAIVRTIGELAHRLGLVVVAEGVETEEIGAQLAAWGFDLLQGYHYARPMDEAHLLRFVYGRTGAAAPTTHQSPASAVPSRPVSTSPP